MYYICFAVWKAADIFRKRLALFRPNESGQFIHIWNNVDALTGYTMGSAHAIAESVGIYNNLFNVKGSPEPIWGIRLGWLALSFGII